MISVGVSISSSDGAKSLCFDEISGSWTYFCKSTMLLADCISGMFDIVVFTLLSVTPSYAATAYAIVSVWSSVVMSICEGGTGICRYYVTGEVDLDCIRRLARALYALGLILGLLSFYYCALMLLNWAPI